MTYVRSLGLSFFCLLIVGVVAVPTQVDAAAYIKFDGVDGESKDSNHDKWIDVLSIDWGSRASGPPQSGRGNVSIIKRIDKSSPKLQEACATGKRFKKVQLSTLKSGSRATYLKYELRNVRLRSCGDSSSSGAIPTEQISLNYEKIKWVYSKEDKKSSRVASSPATYSARETTARPDTATMSRATTTRPSTTTTAASVQRSRGDPTLDARMQRALETGDIKQATAACGAACAPGGGKISAGTGGGQEKPDCTNGNCSCNGVVDCVGMTELCVPDTIGCNDYGCACQHNGTEP